MRTYFRALIAAVLVVLVGVLMGCQPAVTPAPTPAVPPTTEPTQPPAPTAAPPAQPPPAATPTQDLSPEIEKYRVACQDRTDKGLEKQAAGVHGLEYPPFKDLMYVPNQVIVGGDQKSILTIQPHLTFKLQAIGEPIAPEGDTLALYEVIGGTVEQAVCELNNFSQVLKVNLYADPNYYMSPAPGWAGGGSPWTQNGSWVGKIKGGGFGPVLASNPESWFLKQWAFREFGIQLFDDQGTRLTKELGKDVIVAVFDTSPFNTIKGQGTVPFDTLFGDSLGEAAMRSPDLIVVDHGLTELPGCPGKSKVTGANLETQDISNHGLFVAGLVHTVAPQSQIYLIRVLEDAGCGDLFAIERSLSRFMDDIGPQAMQRAVINLSLGVHAPDDATSLGLPDVVLTLQAVVGQMVKQGAVVVAAAGNDSFADQAPRPSEIPAGDPDVIGVAASTYEQRRSCFSNAGKVAAPGGNGIKGEAGPCSIPATPKVTICQTQPKYCVISLGLNSKTRVPEYIYWAGTSFAAPFVSGQAALLREKNPGARPADIANMIYTTAAATGAPGADGIKSGIADVKKSTN